MYLEMARKCYYERLLIVKKARNKEVLPHTNAREESAIQVNSSIVDNVIKDIKRGRALDLPGIDVVIIKISMYLISS